MRAKESALLSCRYEGENEITSSAVSSLAGEEVKMIHQEIPVTALWKFFSAFAEVSSRGDLVNQLDAS